MRVFDSRVTDAELLRLSEADPEAFSEIYRRHAGVLHRWLERRIGWAASDLTAETFARAWVSRDRFKDRCKGSLLPWLKGIAANLLADAARNDRIATAARERLGLPVELAIEDGYEEVASRLSPRTELRRHLAALPDHERVALDLRVVQELSYEEVGRRLAIRPAAARLRVSRALRHLANVVPEEEL
jgi:RNA polymerase sigma factor (sigma-70 family)